MRESLGPRAVSQVPTLVESAAEDTRTEAGVASDVVDEPEPTDIRTPALVYEGTGGRKAVGAC
jgi:hypothetical protein